MIVQFAKEDSDIIKMELGMEINQRKKKILKNYMHSEDVLKRLENKK